MKKQVIGLVALGALFIGVYSSAYVVREDQQAIVLKFGEFVKTVDEPGLYFKVPVQEQIELLDKRTLRLDSRSWSNVLSSDQKRMVVDAIARFKIADPLKAFQAAYAGFGSSVEAGVNTRLGQILEPAVREVLGKRTLSEIVSGGITEALQNGGELDPLTADSVRAGKRAQIMTAIQEIVNAKAQELGVEIVDVRLKRVDLPAQNNTSIFNRMIAEREREAKEARAEGDREATKIRADADLTVARIIAEANRTAAVTRGQADGQAVRIFANAYGADEDFFEFYRTMEAYRTSLKSSNTRMIMSPNGDFLDRLKSIEGDK